MNLLLFFVFVILPVLEIITFAFVGIYWGWLQAIFLTITTSFLGFSLSKYYQFRAKGNIEKVLSGELPDGHILDNMMLYLACFLLTLPGFLTDFAGLFLLIPWCRRLTIRFVGRRLSAGVLSGFDTRSSGFYFHTQSSNAGQDAYGDEFTTSRSTHSRLGGAPGKEQDDDIIDVDFEVKK
ncbi:MAG: FxsA family protein [Thermoguttaceae bacterium]|nr:FxsA family protein [Thermoguttaceae bacterium]